MWLPCKCSLAARHHCLMWRAEYSSPSRLLTDGRFLLGDTFLSTKGNRQVRPKIGAWKRMAPFKSPTRVGRKPSSPIITFWANKTDTASGFVGSRNNFATQNVTTKKNRAGEMGILISIG